MHELSIVLSIVDIAEEQVKKVHAHKVDSIELEIGSLAGVEMSALDFSWSVAVKNTVLDNAVKSIDHIQATGKCAECGTEFEMEEPYQQCPVCFNQVITPLKGKELRVKALTVS